DTFFTHCPELLYVSVASPTGTFALFAWDPISNESHYSVTEDVNIEKAQFFGRDNLTALPKLCAYTKETDIKCV
ncbi:hypothetical protein PMAYCL1PPCAC_20204, partial [Pristionchus mayeri]